jgi:hypothetical protein
MTNKILRPLFLAAFAATLTFATAARAAIAPAENLLPSDTLGFFTVPDCAALRTASKVSPQLMFWNDPAMKPFHDKFMAKLTEKYITPLEKDLGMKVADFADLPQGQFTLGVTVNGSNGHDDIPPGLVLLLDAKGKGDQLKTNLATLVKKWTDNGRTMRTEKIRGLAFTVVTLSSNDLSGILGQRTPVSEIGKEPKPEKPVDIYFTQYESLLIVGNSPKVIEPVAAHLTGGSVPAIADDATFAGDKVTQFRDAPTYYGWFNSKLLFNLMAQATEAPADPDVLTGMPKMSPAKILIATGLNNLKSASFALRQGRDGSTGDFHLTAPADARSGILKILSLSAKDASAPAFVPADAVKFSRFRLDGKQTWAELQKMVAAISPQGLAGINSAIDMVNVNAQQKEPSFDLRNNLFGNLGDDIISYEKPPVGDSLAALSTPPTLTLIATANADQMIQALKAVAALLAPQGSEPPREYRGHKIYSIAMRQQRAPGGAAVTTPPLLISSSGGYLALSANAGIIEEFLRSSDDKVKPLRELPGLVDAAAHVGGMGGGLFSYQNQRDVMRTSFKLLKNAGGSDSTMKMFPPEFREWLDFTLLPDYDQVSKYFYLSVFGASSSADGMTLKVFTPRPPQLN